MGLGRSRTVGCDIHLSAEKKVDGKWVEIDRPLRPCWSCDGTGKNDHYKEPFEVHDCKWDKEKQEEIKSNFQTLPAGTCGRCRGTGKAPEDFYHDRNYSLFSILAGVRVHGDVTPISPERGIPEDASPTVAEVYEDWGGDAHSASWYSLDELLTWDWDSAAGFNSGIVSMEVFKKYLTTKEPPDSYCQGIGGPNVVVADPTWLAQQILHEQTQPGKFLKEDTSYHTRLNWPQSYKEMAGDRFLEVLQELKGIAEAEKLPLEHVRIVFYFDN